MVICYGSPRKLPLIPPNPPRVDKHKLTMLLYWSLIFPIWCGKKTLELHTFLLLYVLCMNQWVIIFDNFNTEFPTSFLICGNSLYMSLFKTFFCCYKCSSPNLSFAAWLCSLYLPHRSVLIYCGFATSAFRFQFMLRKAFPYFQEHTNIPPEQNVLHAPSGQKYPAHSHLHGRQLWRKPLRLFQSDFDDAFWPGSLLIRIL